MWENFTTIFEQGLLPNCKFLIDFLLSEKGMFLGVVCICLPLLGRLIRFFRRLF